MFLLYFGKYRNFSKKPIKVLKTLIGWYTRSPNISCNLEAPETAFVNTFITLSHHPVLQYCFLSSKASASLQTYPDGSDQNL